MILELKHPYIYIKSIDKKELYWLRSKLTWFFKERVDGQDVTVTKTLLEEDKGVIRFLHGLYVDLKKISPFEIDLINKPEYSTDYPKVEPDLLHGIRMDGKYDFQLQSVQSSVYIKKGLVYSSVNCLAGDTEINIHRCGVGRKYTIKRLFNLLNNNPEKIKYLRCFDTHFETYVRSYFKDSGIIRLNKIKKVYYSGKKEVFKLVLDNGLKIKCTKEHKLMTKDGWKTLGNIKINEYIMCDSLLPKKSKKVKQIPNNVYIHRLYNHPNRSKSNSRVLDYRVIYESYKNKLSVDEYIDILRNNKYLSKTLWFIPKNYDVHHIDGNRKNNKIDNLLCLSKKDHRRLHKNDNYIKFNQGVPTFSKVISIEFSGIEDTYDIECFDNPRNFIANGMVVHNSGKTEVILATISYLLLHGYINKASVVFDSSVLAQQFRLRAIKRGFDVDDVGFFDGKTKDFSKLITPIVCNSLHRLLKKKIHTKKEKEFIDDFKKCEYVGFDECQAASGDMYSTIYKSSEAEYLIGYSGSPFSSDIPLGNYTDAAVRGLFGRNIIHIPQIFLRKRGISAEPYLKFQSLNGSNKQYRGFYPSLYKKYIVNNNERNQYIVEYNKLFINNNLPTLNLVTQKEHAILLAENCYKNYGDIIRPVIYFGGNECSYLDNGKLVKEIIGLDDFVNDFNNDRWNAIFATKVFDKGVDIPYLGALIFGAGGKAPKQIIQRLGRGARKKDGLNRYYIIDFIDNYHQWFFDHYEERFQIYKDEKINFIYELDDLIGMIKEHK